MPLYEYYCHECGETFEVLQKMSDPPLMSHPRSSGGFYCPGPLEKLFSAAAFHFKGAGFYATDYSNHSSPASKPKSDSEPKASDPACDPHI